MEIRKGFVMTDFGTWLNLSDFVSIDITTDRELDIITYSVTGYYRGGGQRCIARGFLKQNEAQAYMNDVFRRAK